MSDDVATMADVSGIHDWIRLRRIGVFAYHGVHEEERQLGQRFYISAAMRIDLGPASRTDDLSSSVCYATVAALIQKVAVERQFRLIEALAEAIAAGILRDFPRVAEVTVEVEKPGAAVVALLDGIAVSITRTRRASGAASKPPGRTR